MYASELNTDVKPAPWKLRGDGYLFFYRFNDPVEGMWGDLPPHLQEKWRGGMGAVAWMRYRSSPVGPYDEILCIPGRFAHGRKNRHSVTRIYVNSHRSIQGGRQNWGLPKYYADFRYEQIDTNTEQYTASLDGYPFAQAVMKPGLAKFPLNTRLCPIQLGQWWEGHYLQTELRLNAGVSLMNATLQIDTSKGAVFPNVNDLQPIGTVKLWNFEITFPAPKHTEDAEATVTVGQQPTTL